MTSFEHYTWLDRWDGADPSWTGQQASCFTFLHDVRAAEVAARLPVAGLREVDLRDGYGDVAIGVAILDGGSDWTVVWQDNGYPEQFPDLTDLTGRADVSRAVTVFWNVNSMTEFCLREAGVVVCRFEFPDDVVGTDPTRLAPEMQALGITPESYENDTEHHLARLMSLAERVTGVRLAPDFLRRMLWAAPPEFPSSDGDGSIDHGHGPGVALEDLSERFVEVLEQAPGSDS